jgi:hypothetical protein
MSMYAASSADANSRSDRGAVAHGHPSGNLAVPGGRERRHIRRTGHSYAVVSFGEQGAARLLVGLSGLLHAVAYGALEGGVLRVTACPCPSRNPTHHELDEDVIGVVGSRPGFPCLVVIRVSVGAPNSEDAPKAISAR